MTVFLVWIYPICAHWSFGNGWLHGLNFHDFAGASTVNVVGGVCALVATILLKARDGRFRTELSSKFVRYNELYVLFGTLIVRWIKII
jgi:Amt family ammonium transporter